MVQPMKPTLLCLTLLLCAGCASTTAPTVEAVTILPALRFASDCDEIAVWEIYIDGHRHGLYAFPVNSTLTLDATEGTHDVVRTQWRPNVQDVRETVVVKDTTVVRMACR